MYRKLKGGDRGLHTLVARAAMVCVLSQMAAGFAVAQTAGAFANGLSAEAVSRGGTMAAEHGDPLDAVEGNPAGLAGLRTRVLDLSGVGLVASGSFQNSVDPNGKLIGVAGALPYAALGVPLGKSRWTAALAVTPDALMRVNWQYLDPAGTAGVSYGLQENKSELLALRSSAALAWTMGSKWSAGATVGLVYNSNTLKAPYIFQQQPQLAGLKVLLDLNTAGFGWNGSAGAQWRPSDRVQLGAAWKSATYVPSLGDASGSASALFTALGIGADPSFHYRAEVDNELPQTAAAGLSWQASRRMRWGLEGDWIDWAQAFKQLPVKLTQGTNATINSVVGSDAMEDAVPLHWRNQGVVRLGVEMPVKRGWVARAGYSYMSNPVPGKTLTPMTAAILQNSLSAGAGWSTERWQWSLAYQAQLPASESVGTSALQAGEYDNSRVQVLTQSVTASVRINF